MYSECTLARLSLSTSKVFSVQRSSSRGSGSGDGGGGGGGRDGDAGSIHCQYSPCLNCTGGCLFDFSFYQSSYQM